MSKLTMLHVLSWFYTPRFNWFDYFGYGAYFVCVFYVGVHWMLSTFLLLIWVSISSYYQELYAE